MIQRNYACLAVCHRAWINNASNEEPTVVTNSPMAALTGRGILFLFFSLSYFLSFFLSFKSLIYMLVSKNQY